MSVNQIADTLDLSKGALYEMIRPLPAEVACPTCGAEAVHPNRTALERGLVTCLSCGWDGDEARAKPLTLDTSGMPHLERSPSGARGQSERVRPLTVPILIGAAIGVAAWLWAARRK